MRGLAAEFLLVALTAVVLQVTWAKPIMEQQNTERNVESVPVSSQKDDAEAELEDLMSLTGQKNAQTKPVPMPVAAVPQAVSDDRLYQGAKQALKAAKQLQPAAASNNAASAAINQQDAAEDYTAFDPDKKLDLTPRAVAEYLLITGDFRGFDNALQDLLTAQVITKDDARLYKDAVGSEYERLLTQLVGAKQQYLKDLLQIIVPEAESDSESSSSLDGEDAAEKRAAAENVKAAPQKEPEMPTNPKMDAVELSMALKQLQLTSLLEQEQSLDELLQAVVEEYLIKGMDNENVRAAVPKAAVKINPQQQERQHMQELLAGARRQRPTEVQNGPGGVADQGEAETGDVADELSQIAAQAQSGLQRGHREVGPAATRR